MEEEGGAQGMRGEREGQGGGDRGWRKREEHRG